MHVICQFLLCTQVCFSSITNKKLTCTLFSATIVVAHVLRVESVLIEWEVEKGRKWHASSVCYHLQIGN